MTHLTGRCCVNWGPARLKIAILALGMALGWAAQQENPGSLAAMTCTHTCAETKTTDMTDVMPTSAMPSIERRGPLPAV